MYCSGESRNLIHGCSPFLFHKVEDSANPVDPTNPQLSTAVNTAFRLVAQFSSGPVHDPALGITHSGGLVATEFIVAALLLEGTNVAADILQRLSKGAINSQSILKVINVDLSTILRPRLEHQGWESFSIGKPAHDALSPWFPDKLPKLKSLPKAPTTRSNWLVPDHLLIGAKPGGYYFNTWPDLEAYLKVGINTFVCLIGELRDLQAYRRNYPSEAEKHGANAEFIHFRICDFETVDRETLQPFVLELARRLRQGEKIYVHCLGGHGRTGMVIIPVIAALYDLDDEIAGHFVEQATALGREEDRRRGYVHEMPETDSQADIASSANPYVRKHKR